MITKEDFDKVCNIERQVKFFKREDYELGDVTIVRNTETKQQYLVKEKIYSDVEEFTADLRKTMNRTNISKSNILKFYDYSSISKVDHASKHFKIRLFYDYWEKSLRKEIRDRRNSGNDFSIEELTYLFYDVIEACAYLEEKEANHGDLSPGVIFIDDDNRFVLADRLKSKARFPQNLIDKFLRSEKLYLPPEVFKAIKLRDSKALHNINAYKADVFSLGLTFMEVGNMADVTGVYKVHAQEIDRQTLQKHVSIFENRYSNNPFICAILKKMLEIDEYKRPTFTDLLHAMPEITLIKEYFSRYKGKSNNQRNHVRNAEYLKSNPHMAISMAIESNRHLSANSKPNSLKERRTNELNRQNSTQRRDSGMFKKNNQETIYKEEKSIFNDADFNEMKTNRPPNTNWNPQPSSGRQVPNTNKLLNQVKNQNPYMASEKDMSMANNNKNTMNNLYQQYGGVNPLKNSVNFSNNSSKPQMYNLNNRIQSNFIENSNIYFNSNTNANNTTQQKPAMLPRKPSDGNLLASYFNMNSNDNVNRGHGQRIAKSNNPTRNSQFMIDLSNQNCNNNYMDERNHSRNKLQSNNASSNNNHGFSNPLVVNHMNINSQRNPPMPSISGNTSIRRGLNKNPPVKTISGPSIRKNSGVNESKREVSDKRIFKIFE